METAGNQEIFVVLQERCYNENSKFWYGEKDRIIYAHKLSCKPLWHTLVERNMRKEDLWLAAGLTTNMIAHIGKGKHINMETLTKICETLNCGIFGYN